MAVPLSPLREQAMQLLLKGHTTKFLATPTPEQLSKIDFSDKTTLAPLVVAVSSVFIGLLSSVVCLRLYVRHIYSGRFYLDDYLVVVATLFTLVVCTTGLAATRFGLGKHIWNLDLDNLVGELRQCIQLTFVMNVFYTTAIAFTKLSIIASYNHIFAPRGPAYYTLVALGIVTIGLGIASIPSTILECIPVRAAWTFSDPHAKCYPFTHFLYASTAINTLTDIVLCIVPIPLFWGLGLPRRQKVMVSVLFFLGGFACIASIIRLAYLHLLKDPIDVTYDLVSNVVWTMAELTIGIVCVSLPPLRALLARVLPVMFKASRHANKKPSAAAAAAAAAAKTAGANRASSQASLNGSSAQQQQNVIILSSAGTGTEFSMVSTTRSESDRSEMPDLPGGTHDDDNQSLTVVNSTAGSIFSRSDEKGFAKSDPEKGFASEPGKLEYNS